MNVNNLKHLLLNLVQLKLKLLKWQPIRMLVNLHLIELLKILKIELQCVEAAGNSHQEAELKGVEEYAIECSILKVAVSEDVQNCADEGIQIFGGMGFSEETPMESAWRDASIARIYEGTNEINRMLSVGMLVKKR